MKQPTEKQLGEIRSFLSGDCRDRHMHFCFGDRSLYIRRNIFGFDVEVFDDGSVWEGLYPFLDEFEPDFPLRIEFNNDAATVGNLMLRYKWHLYGDSHKQGAPSFINLVWLYSLKGG